MTHECDLPELARPGEFYICPECAREYKYESDTVRGVPGVESYEAWLLISEDEPA